MDKNKIILDIFKIFNKDQVILDDHLLSIYAKDLSTSYLTVSALCAVFPENKDQLVELIQLAIAWKIGLVPSGGRTGYSGGAMACQGEIVVSFEKMNRIIHFDASDKTVWCESGVTLRTIQNIALQHNLLYPVDFASANDCQIGGNVSTNAGGIHVIRYGSTRNWISGLTVITGNAEIIELNYGLEKNSAGYDLRHLFIGSEGTLGFIAEVILKLTSQPLHRTAILFSFSEKKF